MYISSCQENLQQFSTSCDCPIRAMCSQGSHLGDMVFKQYTLLMKIFWLFDRFHKWTTHYASCICGICTYKLLAGIMSTDSTDAYVPTRPYRRRGHREDGRASRKVESLASSLQVRCFLLILRFEVRRILRLSKFSFHDYCHKYHWTIDCDSYGEFLMLFCSDVDLMGSHCFIMHCWSGKFDVRRHSLRKITN